MIIWKMHVKQGCKNVGVRSPWRLNFVRRCLVFVGTQVVTCFVSPFWRLEFWGGPQTVQKFVNPWYTVTYVLWPMVPTFQTNLMPLILNLLRNFGIALPNHTASHPIRPGYRMSPSSWLQNLTGIAFRCNTSRLNAANVSIWYGLLNAQQNFAPRTPLGKTAIAVSNCTCIHWLRA
jgi:hypothetical protein